MFEEILTQYLPAIITAILSGIAAKILNGCKEKLLNFETNKDKQIEALKSNLSTLTQGLSGAQETNTSIVNSLGSVNANVDDLKAVVARQQEVIKTQAEEIEKLTERFVNVYEDVIEIKAAVTKEE